MYTLLRITGDRELLDRYCRELSASHHELKVGISRRGELTLDLSKQESWDEHQWEVERVLAQIAPVIESAKRAGCAPYVDCGVYVPSPSGSGISVVVRSYRHRPSLLEQLARLEIPYELTIYVQPGDGLPSR
jgi:hypothetical protein